MKTFRSRTSCCTMKRLSTGQPPWEQILCSPQFRILLSQHQRLKYEHLDSFQQYTNFHGSCHFPGESKTKIQTRRLRCLVFGGGYARAVAGSACSAARQQFGANHISLTSGRHQRAENKANIPNLENSGQNSREPSISFTRLN